MLWLAPLVALQATNQSFWRHIQLEGAFGLKADRYKVHINGMHPGRKDGEMQVHGEHRDRTAIGAYRIRWHHAPSIHFPRDKDKDDLKPSSYNPKNIFGFTGNGMTFFGQLLATVDWKRLRIGTGAAIRCSFLEKMVGEWVNNDASDKEEDFEYTALNYTPERAYYFTWSPLLRVGFKLIENQSYSLLTDGTWAPCIYNFSELGKHYYWIYGRNFDLGVTWEKQLAHYINGSLRVAYALCLNNELAEPEIPSSVDELISTVSHYTAGISAQVGISIRIPGLSRCPIAECATKIDHTHGGKYYRGDGIFTDLW
ncbi:hypothetical protein [Cardinium endosymbiont of Nabis limbatus]|uniref:hypothetical protein n=1 Tax=Cardinium endosymbiont of Nabis limbatus TaxID=3066217 RepID=UPI003AF36737